MRALKIFINHVLGRKVLKNIGLKGRQIMALTSPAGPNEFHVKVLLTFYVTSRPYLIKIYRLFFLFLGIKQMYFVFTSYNRNALY